MKHKDGLDIAALLLLLLAAIAAMVVPVALTQPALLAVPAVLVLIALCVVLYQRRRLRAFLARQLCSTDFENSRIQYSLANLPIPTVLVNDGRILWYNQYFGDPPGESRSAGAGSGCLLPPARAGPESGGAPLYGLCRLSQGQPRGQPCVSHQ